MTEFGARAYFQLSSSPAELRVEDIQETEGGTYRCRVDFKVPRETRIDDQTLAPE